MTRTCQVLLEGRYNGVFEPWKHYIPVKADFSNVEEALDALEDHALVERMADQAYQDIVASGLWSYRSFVQSVEGTIIDPAPSCGKLGLAGHIAYVLLRLRDRGTWTYARWEASRAGAAWRRWGDRYRRARARVHALGGRLQRLRRAGP